MSELPESSLLMRAALASIYIAVDKSVAQDINNKVMDEIERLEKQTEQLQKDNKAKQEVIDKLVEGLSEAADALEGCAEYELNSIGKKSQALINSKGEDK